MRVLITGATGFLGRALVRAFLADGAERIVLYSRSESRQAEVAAELGDHPALRFFLGDVRDRERLVQAMWHCDAVAHCAALKRVDSVAYNPDEVRKTNVLGSANVSSAAVEAGVAKVLMISSDKSCLAQNAYGVSKAQMEHEAIAYNRISYPRGTKIACTRYGNVLGSTGSVVSLWRAAVAAGLPIPITDPDMTRFWFTVGQAVDVVREALARMEGGELFVPVLSAMRLGDLAEAVAPGWPVRVIGLRPGGEKRHELLLNDDEATRTVAVTESLYVVKPALPTWRADDPWDGEPFPAGAVYRSDLVPRLSVEEMRAMLKEM